MISNVAKLRIVTHSIVENAIKTPIFSSNKCIFLSHLYLYLQRDTVRRYSVNTILYFVAKSLSVSFEAILRKLILRDNVLRVEA